MSEINDVDAILKIIDKTIGPVDSWAPPYSDIYISEETFKRDVAEELHKLKVRQCAKDEFKIENEPAAPPFDAGTLTEILKRPPEPAMRAEGLIPWESGTLIVAKRKTGKTTLTLNLIRSLKTGEDFLGKFSVIPVKGTIAMLIL
jgi:hypothetical protein